MLYHLPLPVNGVTDVHNREMNYCKAHTNLLHVQWRHKWRSSSLNHTCKQIAEQKQLKSAEIIQITGKTDDTTNKIVAEQTCNQLDAYWMEWNSILITCGHRFCYFHTDQQWNVPVNIAPMKIHYQTSFNVINFSIKQPILYHIKSNKTWGERHKLITSCTTQTQYCKNCWNEHWSGGSTHHTLCHSLSIAFLPYSISMMESI